VVGMTRRITMMTEETTVKPTTCSTSIPSSPFLGTGGVGGLFDPTNWTGIDMDVGFSDDDDEE
jgi:hypothetical protein